MQNNQKPPDDNELFEFTPEGLPQQRRRHIPGNLEEQLAPEHEQ